MPHPKLPAELHERIEAEVAGLGFECVEITFGVESGRRILRITLDAEGGIGLDACARVSRSLAPVLDAYGELPAYYLEVSSPGINRPLTKPEHFRRFRGEVVKVRLLDDLDGGRSLTGVIGDLDAGGVLTVETPAGTRQVPLAQISRARLHRDVDRLLHPRKR